MYLHIELLKQSLVNMSNQITRFGIVNYDIMSDPELSMQAKALYSVLSCYANKERVCWPATSTLADICGTSVSTVDRKIKELKDKGYIKRIGNRKLVLK